MEPKRPADGPSLETYVETRFNLLTKAIDKMESDLLVRIGHVNELAEQAQESAKRAVDKQEAAQAAHNAAANEWRGTLNDFKSTLVGRPEFESLARDFAAYRLEASRAASRDQGEKTGTKDTKEASLAHIGIVVAVVSAVVSLIVSKLT